MVHNLVIWVSLSKNLFFLQVLLFCQGANYCNHAVFHSHNDLHIVNVVLTLSPSPSSKVATSLNMQNLSSGIHVAGVHGVLQMNNNKFEVVPSATENTAGQSMLWGSPLVDGIVANLQEVLYVRT